MNDQDTSETSPIHSLPSKTSKKLSDTSTSSPVIVPTPSVASEADDISLQERKMESSQDSVETQAVETVQPSQEKQSPVPPSPAEEPKNNVVVATKKSGKKGRRALNKSKRKVKETLVSDASSSDGSSEAESTSEDEEKAKRKKKRKLAAKRAATKKKQKERARSKKERSKKYYTSEDETSCDSSDSESAYESEPENKKSRQKALRAKAKKKKTKKLDSSSEDSASDTSVSQYDTESESESEDEEMKRKRAKAKAKAKRKSKSKKSKKVDSSSSLSDSSSNEEEVAALPTSSPEPPLPGDTIDTQVTKVSALLQGLKAKQASMNAAAAAVVVATTKLDKPVKKNVMEFKRVDQVFDMKIRDWKLVESNTVQKDEFDCVFTVRRRLNWEGKYQETQLDIKSKLLRNALQEVFKDCKSISLVEDIPQIDPHTLFHYYDELKKFVKKTLKTRLHKAKRSKEQKRLKQQIQQCKLLLSYIDEDYTATRKALKPMLKAGTITYDLVWALFKPNTIAFTPTYQNKDDPRCFKVDTAYEYESWMTGIKSWYVDGKYLEYDGKSFGLGDHQISIQAFKGHKKITSLAAYPLKYHKDPEASVVHYQGEGIVR